MKDLRAHRKALRLSQSRLSWLSGVSRFKICLFELGDGKLTPAEHERIAAALHAEVERLRNLPNYLQAISKIAQYGAETTDPAEARTAVGALTNDAPRGLRAGGRPSYDPAEVAR